MEFLTRAANVYHILNEEWADERNHDRWLMRSPLGVLALIAAYMLFVLHLGPRIMRHRKPLPVDRLIQLYNIAQIAVSLYMCRECWVRAYGASYSWRCEPLDRSRSPSAVKMAAVTHLYFIVKCAELLDTVFFILKKKDRHISFLHVYHHAGMTGGSWLVAKYTPGGHIAFVGMLNSFVHAVMYTYYLFASLYPQLQSNVWWKKYITQMQMVQFLVVFVHQGQLLISNPCNYPLYFICILLLEIIFLNVLFWNFYQKTYSSKKNE